MAQLTISEEKVREAMSHAHTDEAREIIRNLFPEVRFKKKPTLDDYTSITSYEDACEALGIKPILTTDETEQETVVETGEQHFIAPKHLVALYKLETISRALWGINWVPKPNAEGKELFYWPWFYLWTKEEMDGLNDYEKGALLSANAGDGAYAGFGYLRALYRSSIAAATLGFRLCQETEEKARYFGSRHFAKLWAEYLQFNFTTGDFIE